MCKALFSYLLFLILFSQLHAQSNPQKFLFTGYTQGTTYAVTYYASHEFVAQQQLDSILSVLDNSLSVYNKNSIISKFNNGLNAVVMDEHLKQVVQKAIYINKQTRGIFDITIGGLTKAWGFGADKVAALPDSNSITQLLRCKGNDNLFIKDNTLYKKKACVQLDVNGIAQGYSVDVLAAFLHKKGIKNFLVEIGGELRVAGTKPEGELFTVGIEMPDTTGFAMPTSIKFIQLQNGAVTTSGSYRKFYESNGKKITHIIDARNGWPATNELISVTVLAPNAITADGYDNAIMVMGLEKGIAFVEQHKELAAFFIYKKPDGSTAYFATKQFLKLYKQ